MANVIDGVAKKCNELQNIVETFPCLIYLYDQTKSQYCLKRIFTKSL